MKFQHSIAALVVILGGFITSSSAWADDLVLPQQQAQKHLGVATCASSTCHGSLQPLEKTRVLQNEFVTWSRLDPHSRGMRTLHSEESQRIAANLGLEQPAHKAKVCMDCHLDNPEPKARGRKFTHNDGVGCESCHGGAEKWLKPHTNKNRSTKDNIADGMYPTADPAARAKLCLSCHMGTQDKLATHEIMGAGHPRLSFELQTFTEIQPAHYRIDDDYRNRKHGSDPLQVWIAGVYQNAASWLDLIASDWLSPATIIPELTLFDCQACHHPMSDKHWKPRSSKGLPPGSIRLADSHIMMVWALTSQLQPNEHERLVSWLHELHQASVTSVDKLKEQASIGLTLLKELQQKQSKLAMSTKARRALLERIARGGKTGLFDDYSAAEQAAFAVQLLLREQNPERFSVIAGPLFESVADEDNFNIYRFRAAIGKALD